ncbi:MAG: 4-alpha-glucanotransferase [Hyphomicrobiaceae bacterium]
MSRTALDRLAEAHGIALSYMSEAGDWRDASDAAKRGLLAALGVPADSDAAVDAALAAIAHEPTGSAALASTPLAHIPDWLETGRVWGVTCQLYGIRSERNWGIGDFEDLAALAEILAAHGADFLGVNPLHALFLAEPVRFSPYSPSSRRFLNPLYIAADRIGGARYFGDDPSDRGRRQAARQVALVDYASVSALKRKAFEAAFTQFRTHRLDSQSEEGRDFAAFCEDRGEPLADFALFEAISEAEVERGGTSGWHGWPDELRSLAAVRASRLDQAYAARVLYHQWLQWVADRQLAAAQQRARAAGMRIGLYLDLAVGSALDGADTWCAPFQTLAKARIGAPPDRFNLLGQDWGLAPIAPSSPDDEGERHSVFRAVLDAAVRHAGAIRLDHAMALKRLYLIPEGLTSADGAYIRCPFDDLLKCVAEASTRSRAIVVGEDLGTVPDGFRAAMREANILGYRVLFFERDAAALLPPSDYDAEALACVSTHDLPTLAGWWRGEDISVRQAIGLITNAQAPGAHAARHGEIRDLISALDRVGLLPPEYRRLIDETSTLPDDLPPALAVAVHRFIGRTPSRLVATQLEDMVGSLDCLNIPGTIDEHPNWRRKMPFDISQLADVPLLRAIGEALSRERPRTP